MTERKFENIDVSDFVETDFVSIKTAGFKDSTIMKVVNDGWNENKKRGFLFKNGKKLAIGDLEEFRNIRVYDGIAAISLITPSDDSSMMGEDYICWVENEQSFLYLNGTLFKFVRAEMARNVYAYEDAKFLFLLRDFDTENDYYDNNRYIYTIYSKQYNAFLVNPLDGSITFCIGYSRQGYKNEETIEIVDKDKSGRQNDGNEVLKTYAISDLIEHGYLKPATIPFSAPLHEVKREEQMPEPMTASVNERIEFDTDDIKKMIIEAYNKIEKNK